MNRPDADTMLNRHAIIRGRMKGHMRSNTVEMTKWHKSIVVENGTMSDLEISNLASSNHRAAAAQKVFCELEHADTAEYFDETLSFLIRMEMRAGGTHEKLAVYLEAHQILSGEDQGVG